MCEAGYTPQAVVSELGAEFVEGPGVWDLRGGGAERLGLYHVTTWHILMQSCSRNFLRPVNTATIAHHKNPRLHVRGSVF